MIIEFGKIYIKIKKLIRSTEFTNLTPIGVVMPLCRADYVRWQRHLNG